MTHWLHLDQAFAGVEVALPLSTAWDLPKPYQPHLPPGMAAQKVVAP